MTGSFRTQKTVLYYMVAGLLILGERAVAQHQPMDCTLEPTTHVKLAEGDQSSAAHLQLSRKVSAGASLDLDVCDADLTIKGGKDDFLRISVDFESGASKLPAGDYLQALDVTSDSVKVKLYLPRSPRAKVLIVVPANAPRTQLNLVRGDLSFETDRISADRRINVVFGHVDFLGNPDSYKTLHASVLLGSYHDHRPPNQSAHGMVSKSLSGTGSGSIEINVVRGSLDLRAWD
jgi:hypothetical protein